MQEMRKNTRTVRSIIYLAVLALVIVLDQITKALVVHFMELEESVSLIPGVLNFTYITNDGAAFGMLSDNRWIFLIISTVAVVAISVYVIVSNNVKISYAVPLAMIAGGGFGNMIDRIFNGEIVGNGVVVDFIDFCAFPEIWTYIFNVADAFVCVGAGVLIVIMIVELVVEAKAEKAKKAANNAAQEETTQEEPKNDI